MNNEENGLKKSDELALKAQNEAKEKIRKMVEKFQKGEVTFLHNHL